MGGRRMQTEDLMHNRETEMQQRFGMAKWGRKTGSGAISFDEE